MTTQFDSSSEIWSFATKEVLDTLPKPWTRGILYLLISFILIVLPWSMLSKVDETGSARGKLEPKGDTVKLDSAVTGTVEKIHVFEGQVIEKGQSILTLDSRLIETEIQQAEDKLEGQNNRLSQLNLVKNQLNLSLLAQQQQNQAQDREKQSQIAQAQENLEALKNSANLPKSEKLAQVNQAKVILEKSQTENTILESRYQIALNEIERFQKALQEGIISEAQLIERQDNAKEIERLYEQTKANIKEAKERLIELQSLYQQIVEQTATNIKQAELKLQEQQRSYQSLEHSNQMALSKIEEQIKNLETEIVTLQSDMAQTQSQIKSLLIQLNQRTIKANTSGTIFLLPIKKAGAVVQAGTRIAEIAPTGSQFILKAEMPTNQSSFLKTELPVKLKFDAYPFQDYGIVEGRLKKISPTTIEADSPNGKVTAYQLEIELNKTCISKGNSCVSLHPGDTATAEVIIRQRRVIDFVLDPFKKLEKEGLKL